MREAQQATASGQHHGSGGTNTNIITNNNAASGGAAAATVSHTPAKTFIPLAVDTLHAAQVEYFRARIHDSGFWSLRTLYPAPSVGSAAQCVLQNESLTRFGGLSPECDDLLYIVITKTCALRPSCAQLYCEGVS